MNYFVKLLACCTQEIYIDDFLEAVKVLSNVQRFVIVCGMNYVIVLYQVPAYLSDYFFKNKLIIKEGDFSCCI